MQLRACGFEPLAGGLSGGFTLTRWSNNRLNTTQMFEGGQGRTIGGASHWWRLRTPLKGYCTVSTAGSDFDTVLGVYRETGDLMGLLQEAVGWDDNGGDDGKTSWLRFGASENASYFVVVDGVNGATGQIKLAVTLELSQRYRAFGKEGTKGFRLIADVPKRMVFRIESSSDLKTWLPLISTNAPEEVLDFADLEAAQLPQRFYKAVSLE